MQRRPTSEAQPDKSISRQAALEALDRVLASQSFASAARLREFLTLSVHRTLDDSPGRLKEQEIGAELYGREVGYDPHTDPVVRVAARQLRFKLADYYAGEGNRDRVRISLPKGGYTAEFVPVENATAAEAPRSDGEAQTASATGRRMGKPAAVAGSLLIILAASWWLSTSRQSTPHIRSVVVLPFQNLSGNPANDYISDGITEELTSALVRIPNLRVVARTSAYQFKGQGVDIRKIGQILDVDAVLEGSVLQAGERLRVAAQLNRTSNGYHVWAENFDRGQRESAGLADAIARAVSAHLAGLPPPIRKVQTDSAAAHNDYLMGRYLLNQRSAESIRKSIQYFEKTVAQDGNYAAAYASLSSAWLVLMANDYLPASEASAKVRSYGDRAVALDPSLGEAHAALGMLAFEHDWNWTEAQRELRRAVELTPGDELCHHFLGAALMWEGMTGEAIAELQKAAQLDPLAPGDKAALILFYAYSRQPDQAIAEARKVLDAFPDFFLAHASLGEAYEMKHQYSEAIAEFERELALAPKDPDALTRAAHVYAVSGQRAKALPLLARLEHPPEGEYVPPTDLAMVYAGLGKRSQALAALRRGLQDRATGMTQLQMDPAFDPLRSDAEFQGIMRQVGLWSQ